MLSTTPLDVANALAHSPEHLTQEVAAAYQQYLGRSADSGGVQHWLTAMQQGMTREQLEADFVGSPEYIADHGGAGAGWVNGMYHDLLARDADAQGLDSWLNALQSNVSPVSIALGFASSREREANEVADDYEKLFGRTPDAAEVDGWVNAFEHGSTNDDIVAGMVGSAEFFHDHGNDDASFVDAAYQELLGRPADAAGKQHFEDDMQPDLSPAVPNAPAGNSPPDDSPTHA